LSYDGNGNILALQRFGAAADEPEDDFRYEYDGNKLMTLRTAQNPAGHSFEYDLNGNMTKDGLNSLQLEYNFLNLTGKVSDMSDNTLASYKWLADGTKIGVKDATGSQGFEYIGSLIYKYVNGELQLESAGFGGGRIQVSNGSNGNIYTPNYYITDHLGSTRAVVTANPDAPTGFDVLERNNYQPFGMPWQHTMAQISDNRYLYNGQELQTIGLPETTYFFDYGARVYDSFLIRWKTQDKMSEMRYFSTPYGYCLGNPILNIDFYGLIDWKTVWNGSVAMTGGIIATAGGAFLSASTGGVGAALGGVALMTGGLTTAGFGFTQIVDGFANDGGELVTEGAPEGYLEVTGMAADKIMENENGEGRSVGKMLDGATGLVAGKPKSLMDAIGIVFSAGQVAEGATELYKASEKSAQSATESVNSRPNYLNMDNAAGLNDDVSDNALWRPYSKHWEKYDTIMRYKQFETIELRDQSFVK
jgi:RHS repeat-associated protein